MHCGCLGSWRLELGRSEALFSVSGIRFVAPEAEVCRSPLRRASRWTCESPRS